MKKVIFSSMVVLLLCSCKEEGTARSIVVLHDVTHGDSTSPELNFASILKMDQHTNESTEFSYTQITDSDYNETFTTSIGAVESVLFSNQYEREEEINLFIKQVDSLDTRVGKELEHSAIWIPLWNRIQVESKKKNTSTSIYLISDCVENDFINFHDPQSVLRLERDPSSIRELFIQQIPKNLDGKNITVIICHHPKNKRENDVFRMVIRDIYQPIMDSVGIELETRSNL